MLGAAIGWAFRRGLRDGVAGGSGPWVVVAAVAGLWQLARRPSKGKAVGLKLKPGDRFVITCSDEPGRR
jgi:hypothetical protein